VAREPPLFSVRTQPGQLSADGRKAWSIRYQAKGGERRRETMGTYPLASLAAARQRTKDIGAAAAKGIGLPAVGQREREELRKADNRPRTIGDLVDGYVERYCKPNLRKWTLPARMFESHVKATIGRKPQTEQAANPRQPKQPPLEATKSRLGPISFVPGPHRHHSPVFPPNTERESQYPQRRFM
jgi:Arm DNA-binding domain